MIYLSGHFTSHTARQCALAASGALGALCSPQHGNRVAVLREYPAWGADNACFTQPDQFSLPRYLAWLTEHESVRDRCLFATAPDVVGDAAATLARSLPVLPQLRALGYPAALVAQDGMEHLALPWADFDVLFVGGTTDWKLSAGASALAAEARRRGKWCHLGRVNSRRRLHFARAAGYQSADGTYLAFAPDQNSRRLLGWLRELERQPLLFGGHV